MRVIRIALVYFLVVFGAGFVLGTVRTLLVAPAVGETAAQLIEAPLMLVVIVATARALVRRHAGSTARLTFLLGGLLAALLVLIADLGVGVLLRGMGVVEVLFGRELAPGAVYHGLLTVFALAPWFLARRVSRDGLRP